MLVAPITCQLASADPRRRSSRPRLGLLIALALVVASGVAWGAPPGGRVRAYQDRVYARVQPRDTADLERLWSLAEDILTPHDPALVEHEVIVTRATLA